MRRAAFLREYAQHGVASPALRVACATRGDLRRWREDAAFEEALAEAHADAVDAAEHELRTRAVEGWEEVVTYRGEPVWRRDPDSGDVVLGDDFEPVPFTVRRRSDRLLEFYIKAHRTEYKERSELAITGPKGGPVKSDITVRYVLPDGKTEEDYDGEEPF